MVKYNQIRHEILTDPIALPQITFDISACLYHNEWNINMVLLWFVLFWLYNQHSVWYVWLRSPGWLHSRKGKHMYGISNGMRLKDIDESVGY